MRAVVLVLSCVACTGVDPTPHDAGPAPDGAVLASDAGFTPDAGLTPDAGITPDAGLDGGVVNGPSCTTDGCLRSWQEVGAITLAELDSIVDPSLTLDNGYRVYAIRFFTDGWESTATVAVPDVAPPAGGFHVVANNHGTTGLGDVCQLSGTVFGAGLAGLFGARGAIGVAVDYAGLGTPGLHPYLVAQSEGASVLDGLRATRHLTRVLQVPISERFAAVGLSQGGHATIAAAAMHDTYASELDIRAFGATAPASVWPEQWARGAPVAGPHHTYYVMALYSWRSYYEWGDAPIFTASVAATLETTFDTYCVGGADGAPTLFTEIPNDPSVLYHPAFFTAFSTGAWRGYEHVENAFGDNALRPYRQTAPLRIYQGTLDDTILPDATADVVEALRAGGVEVELQTVEGGTHTNVAFGYVAFSELRTEESIAWVRARLDE